MNNKDEGNNADQLKGEGQRVYAILNDLLLKAEVVEMLKSELFDEILKPDAPDLAQIFDEDTANLLLGHAEIE